MTLPANIAVVAPYTLAVRGAIPLPPNYAARNLAKKQRTDPLAPARKEMRALANSLFVQSQRPYHIHARKSLAAFFDGIYPHALTWAELCEAFDPDPLPWLPDFDKLPKSYQKELLAIFDDEVDVLRSWGKVLLSWTTNNQSVIDTATEDQLNQINALTAAVEAGALPAGYVRYFPDRVRNGARYDIIANYGQVYTKVKFDKARHCFAYVLPTGEHGAVPVSQVSHLKQLPE